MDKTLFDLSDELLQLDEALSEISEADTEAFETVLQEYMNTLQDDLSNKLNGYCKYISELENRAEIRKNEAKRLLARSKVDENLENRLKEALKWFFRMHNLSKYETQLYRVSLCGNGGKLPIEILVPIEDLPAEYIYQDFTYVVDMERLRADLESGQRIYGTRIGERGQSIRIK